MMQHGDHAYLIVHFEWRNTVQIGDTNHLKPEELDRNYVLFLNEDYGCGSAGTMMTEFESHTYTRLEMSCGLSSQQDDIPEITWGHKYLFCHNYIHAIIIYENKKTYMVF